MDLPNKGKFWISNFPILLTYAKLNLHDDPYTK